MLGVQWAHVERQRLRLVHGVPRVVADLLDGDALRRISLKDTVDHVLRLRRQELGQRVVCVENLSVQVRRLLVLERQIAAEHGVEDDTARPQVRHEAVILLASDHLQTVSVKKGDD